MNYIYLFLIDFVFIFVFMFSVYLVYYKYKKKDYNSLKNSDTIKIFIAKYNLDVRKVNYKTILRVLAFDNAFTMAFTAALIISIKGYIWKVLVCLVVLISLLYSSYEIIGKLLKKKEGKKNV